MTPIGNMTWAHRKYTGIYSHRKVNSVESKIMSFISAQKSRAENREITAGTVGNAIKAVRVLCEMNDIIDLNWKKIKRILPKARKYALDRIPTIKEVQNIVEAADIRSKALTYTFISSGIREGAVQALKVSDYTPIEGVGRLVIYNGDPARYVTFISSEACNALDKYLDFRREHGEVVTAESPLFDPVKGLEGRGNHGHTRKDANEVVMPMTSPSVRQYYNRILFSIGIRRERQRRHEFSVHESSYDTFAVRNKWNRPRDLKLVGPSNYCVVTVLHRL
jgi:integrase